MARLLRLEPDQIFAGVYKVVRTLGKGSMGVVYLAESTVDQQRFALKLLLPEALQDDRAMERFQREATASKHIASDHVVKTLEAGIDPASQTPWLLMEYVEGKHLDELFEPDLPPPSPAHRRKIIEQLFQAVSAVHAAGFVHRDLKPENIVVRVTDGSPEIKLLDLGVAKRLGVSPNNSTAQGLGTPLWTAPEQSTSSRGLSPAADVWALGLLTFFILTGRLYWKGANQEKTSTIELIIEIARGDLPAPSVRVDEFHMAVALPPRFDDWFCRCVARDPASRFADASEASRYLAEILDRRPSTMPPPPAPSLPRVAVGPAPQAAPSASREPAPPTLRVGRPAASPLALAGTPLWQLALAALIGLLVAGLGAWLVLRR